MKNQLVLLSLVVLFVSLSSVVFAQPPLRAVQSGETSQAAPKVEAVKKSWEGPVFGLGLGLGLVRAGLAVQGETLGGSTGGTLPVRVRLGYGLSDRVVLYAGFGREYALTVPDNALGDVPRWNATYGVLGMMFRGARVRENYGFLGLGATTAVESEGYRARGYVFRGGSGFEVNPGLSLEATCQIRYVQVESVSITGLSAELTFNYHFY